MKPVGLSFKNVKENPYTGRRDGDLMLVHQCQNCGHISCNRIAGDDNNYSISCLLENTASINPGIIYRLKQMDIILLSQDDTEEVLTSIYGYGYKKYTE